MKLGNVSVARITANNRREGKGGVAIIFTTEGYISIGDIVMVPPIKGKNHYFRVISITAKQNNWKVEVEAKEAGYYRNKLDYEEGFDIRTLAGSDVFHVKNEELSRRLEQSETMC